MKKRKWYPCEYLIACLKQREGEQCPLLLKLGIKLNHLEVKE